MDYKGSRIPAAIALFLFGSGSVAVVSAQSDPANVGVSASSPSDAGTPIAPLLPTSGPQSPAEGDKNKVVNNVEPPAGTRRREPGIEPRDPVPPDATDLSPRLSGVFQSCTTPTGFQNHIVICVDAYATGTPVITALPRSGHVIRPNTPILVMVRRRHSDGVRVTMDGARGIYQPKLSNQTPNESGATERKGSTARPTPTFDSVITTHTFAPRLPGKADITVKIYKDDDTTQPAREELIELEVEATYGGALRVGLGLVGGGAVDREYVARQIAKSGQQEVGVGNNSNFNVELVLGFAPFLDYFFGGRSYAGFENFRRFPFGVSPYVGLGLLNASSNSVEVFKSIYLGLEFEPTPSFSIAAGWVGRRVTRLADGVVLGSPVGTDGLPTTTGFDYGWGVVINVSPEFLRLAQQPGSSYYSKR